MQQQVGPLRRYSGWPLGSAEERFAQDASDVVKSNGVGAIDRETAGVTSSGTLGYLPPTKAQMLASPMTTSTTPSAAQTYPKRLRAVVPGVMPHLAANNQMP